MCVCLQMLTFQNQRGSLSHVSRISTSHNDHFTSARMVAANVNTTNLYNQNHKKCFSSVLKCLSSDTLAEWLRRRPAKPMESPRAGSNPAGVALEFRSNLSSVKNTHRLQVTCQRNAAQKSERPDLQPLQITNHACITAGDKAYVIHRCTLKSANAASEDRTHDLGIMRPTRYQLRYSRHKRIRIVSKKTKNNKML